MKTALLAYIFWMLGIYDGLGSPSFWQRERTQERLERAGYLALPGAVAGTLFSPDCEVRARLARGLPGQVADWMRAFFLIVQGPADCDYWINRMWCYGEHASPEVYGKAIALAMYLGLLDQDTWVPDGQHSRYWLNKEIDLARTHLWSGR